MCTSGSFDQRCLSHIPSCQSWTPCQRNWIQFFPSSVLHSPRVHCSGHCGAARCLVQKSIMCCDVKTRSQHVARQQPKPNSAHQRDGKNCCWCCWVAATCVHALMSMSMSMMPMTAISSIFQFLHCSPPVQPATHHPPLIFLDSE